MNLLNMYTEQHKMYNCSNITKISNLNKSQLDAEVTKADIIFTGRISTPYLVNTPIPLRFFWTQSWELTEKLQGQFSRVWYWYQRQKTTEICSCYVCFEMATQALTQSNDERLVLGILYSWNSGQQK